MRLRLSIALGDQETATSFTSRLAAANGVTAGEFCRDWGFTFGKVVVGDPEAVAKIAELGGVDAGALQASAFVSDARRIRRGGEVLTRLSMRNGKFAVCPACLRSDIRGNKDPDLEPEAVVYGRAPWRIDAVRTCAAHKLALVVFPDHILAPDKREHLVRVMHRIPMVLENITLHNAQPRVQVLKPLLERHPEYDEGPIPHVYRNGDDPDLPYLCLFSPSLREWDINDLVAETTIHWAAQWIYFYEGWLVTKKWFGGGRHVTPNNEGKHLEPAAASV